MTLPSDIGSAAVMLGELVHDPNLGLGLFTLLVILAVSAVLAWVIVGKVQ